MTEEALKKKPLANKAAAPIARQKGKTLKKNDKKNENKSPKKSRKQ
jgi:hypothetical protein